jgi:hypothetical protein
MGSMREFHIPKNTAQTLFDSVQPGTDSVHRAMLAAVHIQDSIPQTL